MSKYICKQGKLCPPTPRAPPRARRARPSRRHDIAAQSQHAWQSQGVSARYHNDHHNDDMETIQSHHKTSPKQPHRLPRGEQPHAPCFALLTSCVNEIDCTASSQDNVSTRSRSRTSRTINRQSSFCLLASYHSACVVIAFSLFGAGRLSRPVRIFLLPTRSITSCSCCENSPLSTTDPPINSERTHRTVTAKQSKANFSAWRRDGSRAPTPGRGGCSSPTT